jgi:hypothetical protein
LPKRLKLADINIVLEPAKRLRKLVSHEQPFPLLQEKPLNQASERQYHRELFGTSLETEQKKKAKKQQPSEVVGFGYPCSLNQFIIIYLSNRCKKLLFFSSNLTIFTLLKDLLKRVPLVEIGMNVF